ncbi:hypothetical protein CC1G_09143 [Coprinopsis cinerea okayama7|uniref:Uncharacterized protein n=1 Tax=Coprinopsis cinerea (strain Okayama-7 / 130 / ATCC MYA-4618 / FGSC 9003) TaxID=240176 RepID=A8P9P6_COPC7|nr:hypothetical protein CC1G_09143 [Coprinopsis cinerea okayama7\|eukprot:XP_001839809.1 hypothetical protein CC1G_09143 [Coprinopsis cinerea okayama7\
MKLNIPAVIIYSLLVGACRAVAAPIRTPAAADRQHGPCRDLGRKALFRRYDYKLQPEPPEFPPTAPPSPVIAAGVIAPPNSPISAPQPLPSVRSRPPRRRDTN